MLTTRLKQAAVWVLPPILTLAVRRGLAAMRGPAAPSGQAIERSADPAFVEPQPDLAAEPLVEAVEPAPIAVEPAPAEAAHPLSRRPGWSLTGSGWAFTGAPPDNAAGYRTIDRDHALGAGVQAWGFRDVADRQHAAYGDLLDDLERGVARRDFEVAAEAVNETGLAPLSLVEIGCGSGYYSRVFERLAPGRVQYTGVDLSAAMISLAKETFPSGQFMTGDATDLPFPASHFDVAMNGVSLMHIPRYERAIRETRRVAKRFCLFHTTIVLEDGPTVFLEKDAYGRRAVETIINEAEFLDLCEREGLRLVKTWESIPYDLFAAIGRRTHARTYLFAISGPSLSDDCRDRSPAERPASGYAERPMLNLGCGHHHHPGWVNVDIATNDADVIVHDLAQSLPFVDDTFGVVYLSHVLEHLAKASAPKLLEECLRVIAPGGVIRVVVPDLEQICRLYVDLVARASAGDEEAELRYDWMVIELLDQMVRSRSGGEMLAYWHKNPMPAADFVMERVGQEAVPAIEHIRAGGAPAPSRDDPGPEEIGRFRLSGEIHQWMYDRFSLGRLLADVGFADARVCRASESAIEGFDHYGLDTLPDGSTRKPDSLFMEARRPQALSPHKIL